jgi:hypothetical protein
MADHAEIKRSCTLGAFPRNTAGCRTRRRSPTDRATRFGSAVRSALFLGLPASPGTRLFAGRFPGTGRHAPPGSDAPVPDTQDLDCSLAGRILAADRERANDVSAQGKLVRSNNVDGVRLDQVRPGQCQSFFLEVSAAYDRLALVGEYRFSVIGPR